ncbi:DUF3788 domain-containing protein [Bradyrhizobium sp. JR4.1]|uniref:DUF3788 domain-containing protein n=1 Tax=Bradyrhizobium sp. JR4.1 TaxID=3156372 RepID=UPI0033923FF5
MMLRTGTTTAAGETIPQIGDRITDKSAPPDDGTVREWIGPDAFEHWAELRNWIDEFYPGVFAPDWLYGGKNRGWSLRYKKTKAFCTLLPEYKRVSAVVVMGGAEREKFEERRYVWRPQLVKLYDEATTYIDGKWLTIAISSENDLHDVTELLAMKRPPPSRG